MKMKHSKILGVAVIGLAVAGIVGLKAAPSQAVGVPPAAPPAG